MPGMKKHMWLLFVLLMAAYSLATRAQGTTPSGPAYHQTVYERRQYPVTPEEIAFSVAATQRFAGAIQEQGRGDVCAAAGQLLEAESHYRKCLHLDATDITAELHLAQLLARLGRYKEAATLYKGILECRNGGARRVLEPSTRVLPKGAAPEKERWTTVTVGTSLAADPTVECEYALVLLKLGYWDTACEVWDQAMRDTIDVPDRIRRGSFPQHDGSQVIAYQDTHPRLSEERFAPNNLRKKEMEALCHWVITAYRLSSRGITAAEKLAHLEAAVKANPKLPEAQCAYGEALVHKRRYAEARPALLLARKYGSEDIKKQADWWIFCCDDPPPLRTGEPAQ